jgi:cytochrome P450
MEPMQRAPAVKSIDEMSVVEIDDTSADTLGESIATAVMRYGPVFRRVLTSDPENEASIIYLVGPEANRFVFQTHREHFSHRGGWKGVFAGRFERGLLNTDNPEHERDRRMMNPAFTIAYMSKYLPIMNRIIEMRTEDWAERGEIDVHAEARKITFDVAAEALVGFRTGEEVDRLRELFYDVSHVDRDERTSRTDQEMMERLAHARQQLDSMLLSAIAVRREAPTDDILGMLVQARDEHDEPFTNRQLLGQVHILLLAGHETTTTLATWVLYLLAVHPDILGQVRSEVETVLSDTGGELTLPAVRAMRFLGHVINEAGRLYPPAGSLPRVVSTDIEFGGFALPVGTKVRISVIGCHRLPTIFRDPSDFDPDRFAPPREEDKRTPYALILFGGGPRVCIGINFAQVEIKILAAHVLQRFALQSIPGREIRQIYHGPMAAIPTGVPVRVTRLGNHRDR